jgi:hypothetical protein
LDFCTRPSDRTNAQPGIKIQASWTGVLGRAVNPNLLATYRDDGGSRGLSPFFEHLEVKLAYRSFRRVGVTFIVGCVLAIGGVNVGAAATKEEVAHCRAIEQPSERLDCFKSLKRDAKAKIEHPLTKRDPTDATNDDSKPTTDDSKRSPPPDDPVTTGSINRLAPGQPLCTDRDALGAMILAGLLTSDPAKAATIGCQSVPDDAKFELLERSPSIFPFMRIIRVKVTSRTKPDLASGFTIELGSDDRTPLKATQ